MGYTDEDGVGVDGKQDATSTATNIENENGTERQTNSVTVSVKSGTISQTQGTPGTRVFCGGGGSRSWGTNGNGGSLENSESSSSPDSDASTPTTPTPSTYSCSFADADSSDPVGVGVGHSGHGGQIRNVRRGSTKSNSNTSIDVSDGDDDGDDEHEQNAQLEIGGDSENGSKVSKANCWDLPASVQEGKANKTEVPVPVSLITQRNETGHGKIVKDTNCLNNNAKISNGNSNTGNPGAGVGLGARNEKLEQNPNLEQKPCAGTGTGALRRSIEFGFNCMSKFWPLSTVVTTSNKQKNVLSSSPESTCDSDPQLAEAKAEATKPVKIKLNNEIGSSESAATAGATATEKQQQKLKNEESQRRIRTLSISKSSSESNIPICHNCLGGDAGARGLPPAISTATADAECAVLPLDGPVAPDKHRIRRNSDSNTKFSDFAAVAGVNKSSTPVSSQNQNSNVNATSKPKSHESAAATPPASKIDSKPAPAPSTTGPKFKLVLEGDVQVCKLRHDQNLMSKLTSSKLLRRWETHHIYLNDSSITSKTPIGSFNNSISYWQMEDMYVVIRWDSGRRYVIRIVLPDGSLLLQGTNAYVRDQWFHSIMWKRNIFKYQNLMRSSKRPEVMLKELMALLDFATATPLQDECISHVPVEIVSNLLESAGELLGRAQVEDVLNALSPLLEKSHPPPSLCRFFSLQCRSRPRCPLIMQHFTPVVRRALKHNVDFGKYPHMRRFIQDYIQAMNSHNDGINLIRNFVKSIHGTASSCPHPRVMSNLVSVCLAAIFTIFERNNTKRAFNMGSEIKDIPWDEQVLSYLAVFDTISEFDDWRPSLAQLLQCMPFPYDAFNLPLFTKSLSSVIRRIGTDHRCCVHQMVMGIRDEKEGWFHQYSPTNLACPDDFELWGLMLGRLLNCCCRRKRFLSQLSGKLLGSCLLLALRENEAAQEALCLLLEWQLISSDDQRVQIATTLQSTPTGSANYATLCSRQLHLKELQQKGGPRKLTLPSRSTDSDLAKLLSCGSFGNLECLSLAFTQVTSACAEQLIKLPSLRYLNLWSTQFGDSGLQLISEHLLNLQVLNLCETPVTDKGLLSLTALRDLRKLNLNSTHLSSSTLDSLKKELPALKEVDVRYTDAW